MFDVVVDEDSEASSVVEYYEDIVSNHLSNDGSSGQPDCDPRTYHVYIRCAG